MKKTELLCPAGNFKMLEAAIYNGADAVYLSGNKFGARKFANNFNNEEIIEAIRLAHLYGVKVYITINTLIKDEEVEEFINFVEFIHKNNVDAVLMQDLGMINLVRKTFPNLEIHASTQFHNHNNEDLKFLKSIGIKRAVLAREMSIDEIKKLDIDIEKEIFVHGALCISYSGECLMSSMILNRSGNRGECAGMCRLPYKLLENDKELITKGNYILSPKELCTIENLKEILDLNIDSIKIEGRMKSPEYVAYVTKLYRKAIDDYYNGKEINISEEELDNLKVLFNRNFTKGYLLNDDNNLMNITSPNHQGIEIGKVINITKNKIKIKLTKNLYQGDAIRFKNINEGMYVNFIYDINGKLINKGLKNQIIFIDNKLNIKKEDIVLKTIDNNLIKEINEYPKKKIPISILIEAKLNKNIKVTFDDGINKVEKLGKNIEKANKQELTKGIIEEKISKLNNTIYTIKNIEINMDNNIFIPISEINNLRREIVNELNYIRANKKTNYKKIEPIFNKVKIDNTNTLNILTNKEEEYKELNKYKVNFYTENLILYKKYKDNKNVYLRLPRIINNNINFKNENLLINDIGTITNLSNKNNIISDIYRNVTNIYTINYLHELGVKKVGLSPELNINEIKNLYNNFIKTFNYIPNIEIFVYGYLELMLLKHCILKENINKNKQCNICTNKNNYYILDRNNKKYKIKSTKCGNIIMSNKLINNIKGIKNIKGINYYISLKDIENIDFIKKEIENLQIDKQKN